MTNTIPYLVSSYLMTTTISYPLLSYLIKVTDDLIEKSNALQSLLVNICFHIELLIIWYRGKHHAHILIFLRVKFICSGTLQHLCGYRDIESTMKDETLRQFPLRNLDSGDITSKKSPL